MRGKIDRWELAAPFDALSWALCLKNRRAAWTLLEKQEALTLGWAPELLNMILDRAPEGEENPRLIWRYLNEKGHGKGPAVLAALSLLGGGRL